MLKLIIRIAHIAVTLIQGLIITKIILIIINANQNNSLVKWIMDTSPIFIKPFEGIVTSSINIGNFSLPVDSLVALLFYVIVGFVLTELLKSFSKE